MARQSASLSNNSEKLVLGGHIISGDLTGYSAIAQVNLADDIVDYAKHFTFANTITSVAHSVKNVAPEIVALAT